MKAKFPSEMLWVALVFLFACLVVGAIDRAREKLLNKERTPSFNSKSHAYFEVDGHEYIAFPFEHCATHSPKCKCNSLDGKVSAPESAKPNRKIKPPSKEGATHYILPTVEVK